MIGHNNPPGPTPFELVEKEIADLFEEATVWLDGATVETQAHADGIGNLLSMLRAAEAKAEMMRVAEKKPLDEEIAKVQKKYAPLIADTKNMKGKTVLAAQACKAALQPWLDAEDRRLSAEAAAARAEADRKREAAEAALRTSEADNLAEREAAEEQLREARKAETAANVASRRTATAGGTFGRAAGLRTTHRAEVTDAKAFARWLWLNDRTAMDEYLADRASQLARAGQRSIPGVTIHEDKIAA